MSTGRRAWTSPRMVAGADVANDIVKCRKRRVDRSDYRVPVTEGELKELTAIFRDGVCDWPSPGWASRTSPVHGSPSTGSDRIAAGEPKRGQVRPPALVPVVVISRVRPGQHLFPVR
ncbi:DUF6351 family protein [Streptomyces sp. NPDC058770]|uniref:DUF6351 family protein n=1 Tax=unclassified Streptomyces TaxID=2593676 RepID=UPI003689C1D9